MKAKAKLYGPMLLAALLCALVFATGAMKKPSEFELLNGQYMQLAGGKTRYAVADGDAYGALSGKMAGLHLPAGKYRLRWMISGDGDNVLRLKNDDGAAITPDEFVLPANEGEGECVFEIEEACENFAVEIEFASGSYLDVYGLKLYTPKYQDDAFTLLFFAIGASVLYGLLATGRLTRRNMAPALFIGLAVLFSCSMSLKSTFNYGHDGAYHLARLQNLADGLKSGQFPVRMGGFSFNGYGAITSVFYPDVFLYPFALMLLGGASAAYVGNVLLAALNIGAAAGMYAAAKRLFQNRWAATCASVLYTLSAYRVMDVYTRVAVGEAMAMAFFPLFIVGLYEALFGDAKCWRMLALSACGIFLSHMLSTMLCAVLAAAGLCRGLSVEKWDRPVLLLMRLLVIIGSSLGVASLVGIPLWNHFFKFSPPLLAVIALPAAGLLALGAILIDNQPESPVERWTGLPRRMGSMVLGCAILVVCVFDCVIPSLTRYRTEKQLYDAILAADLGLSPERIFIWRDDAPSKLLFYLDLQRPVTDSPDFIWRRAFTEEQIRAMTPEQRRAEQQKRNLADLRQFLERNAGHQVAIFSFDRESDLKPLARAAAELGLPIDVEKPDFSERRFDVMESKSRRRSVWTPRLPQTFEEKHEEVK